MDAVRVKGVSVLFDGLKALENISFSVKRGKFVAVIGPNGGGKTTLLKVLLGLLKPSKGEVKVFEMNPEEARGMVGYMPQKISFDQSFPITVFKLVLMGRYRGLLKFYKEEDKKAAIEALEAVGIEELKDRKIGELSGGQIQRAFLARALVRDPELLLLDEPTASIDPKVRKDFYELLSKLKGKKTILLVTHDISAVSIYVDEIACLNKRLFYYGPKEGGLKRIKEVYGYPVELLSLDIRSKGDEK